MRYIKFFLVVVLLLCPLSATAADVTLDETTDFSGTCLTFFFDSQNPISNEQTMLLVSYNDKNQLVGFQALDVAGWEKYHQFPVNLDQYLTEENGGTTLKAFLWNDELQPFATGAVLGKTTQTSLQTPTICTFYENKPGAVSITFDDGNYNSAVYYNSEFKKYDLCGTAMLITNQLISQGGTPEKWSALLEEGYVDVGNHSTSHAIKYSDQQDSLTEEQLKADITDAYDQLKTWFPKQNILTFAAPWGQATSASTAEIKKHHYANRGAGGNLQNANPQEDEWFRLRSYVYSDHSASDMNNWVNQAISQKGWAIELLHNCVDGDTPNGLAISKTIFHDHMEYLASKKEDVWVGTLNEVTAYIKERQNATVHIDWANGQTMALTLTDTLPDEEFSQPLTLQVNVPLSWKNGAIYYQGSLQGTSPVVLEEPGKRYVQINAVPDGGQIILQKK